MYVEKNYAIVKIVLVNIKKSLQGDLVYVFFNLFCLLILRTTSAKIIFVKIGQLPILSKLFTKFS